MRIVRRRSFLIAILLLAAVAIAISIAFAGSPHTSDALTSIEIRATPIASFDNRDPARTRFGALEFRGGLALTSSYEPFGGISAIHVESDGSHFLALTDKGSWLRGRIVYDQGRPTGIADAFSVLTAARSRHAAGTIRNRSPRATAHSTSVSSASKRSCALIMRTVD
jgi:hypothetical protein